MNLVANNTNEIQVVIRNPDSDLVTTEWFSDMRKAVDHARSVGAFGFQVWVWDIFETEPVLVLN